MYLPDAQKNCLLLDILDEHGEQRLDLHMDGACDPLDTMTHATLVQVAHKYLEELVASLTPTEPSSMPTGTGKPRCTGVISLQSGMGCKCQWEFSPEGDTGDVPTGKNKGCGRGSQEPEGHACLVVSTQRSLSSATECL